MFGSYTNALLPGLHVVEGGQTSTGSVVAWFKRTLCAPDIDYHTLNQEAEGVPPGCDGLLCLDHFQVWSRTSRGLLIFHPWIGWRVCAAKQQYHD
jgi:ribulose kinase